MDSYSISSFLYPSPPDTPFTTPSQSTSSTDDLGDPYSIPTNKSMTRKHSLPLTAPNSPESNALDKQIQMVEPSKPDGGSVPIASGSITSNLQQLLGGIDVDSCEVDGESAFFVADLSEVYRQHVRWINALPRVIPFYAVKCNPDPYVLRLLAALGTGFDCASNGEIQSVLDLGVSPSRIIYANPCKASSFVRQAASQGVGLTTFDNIDELYKMKKFHPHCKLVVRILTDDSKSACQLGLKFGAPLATVPRLLEKAKELELDVVGVSFHVGSGCYDPESFRDAILRARKAFEIGKDFGYTFDLLDVGGGYDHSNFEMIADVLRPAIDECFPDQDFAPGGKLVEGKKNGLRIIAEPGRYYVQKAFVLAANIIARRDGRKEDEENSIPKLSEEDPSQKETTSNEMEISTQTASTTKSEEKPEVMYYQNDGMYGAFNCIMFDHQVVHPKVLTLNRQFCYRSDLVAPGVGSLTSLANSSLTQKDLKLRPCSIWGPTCDSIDCVRPLAHLPDATSVGDWLVYEDMGAYTICAASGFNGLRKSEVKYTFGTTKEEDMNADGTAEKVRELMI